MKLFINTCVSAFIFFVASSASAEQVIEQTYDIHDVQALYAGSGISLEVVQGNDEGLRVKASPSMLKHVHVDLTNHKLSLSIESGLSQVFNWFDKNDVVFFVTVKDLNQLDFSGGVDAKVARLDLEKLLIKVSGGSEANFTNMQVKNIAIDVSGGASVSAETINSETLNVQLSGGSEFKVEESSATNFLTIDAGGGSEYLAKKLITQVADVRAGGAAEIDLSVDKTLKVNAGGASSVNYHGKPTVVSDIGGASELMANN